MRNDAKRTALFATTLATALAVAPLTAMALGGMRTDNSATTQGEQHAATQQSQSSGWSSDSGSSTFNQVSRKQTVKKVQRALVRNGANLKVDGVEGHRTKQALEKYQRNHGLRPTGNINLATKKSLLGM